jgi:hypothetical protein
VLAAAEPIERGALDQNKGVTAIPILFPSASPDAKTTASQKKFALSKKQESKIRKEMKKVLKAEYIPDTLSPFLLGFDTGKIVEKDLMCSLAYSITPEGKEAQPQTNVMLTYDPWSKGVVGYLMCPIKSVTKEEISLAAEKLLIAAQGDPLERINYAIDDPFAVEWAKQLKPDKRMARRENLKFPRSIQLDYPEAGLYLRGGISYLQKAGKRADETGIYFMQYLGDDKPQPPANVNYRNKND